MESIDVNYTADGTYATYDDGTPVSMVMTLSFKEIEPVYDVDYGDENNRSRILKWDTSENYQN